MSQLLCLKDVTGEMIASRTYSVETVEEAEVTVAHTQSDLTAKTTC